MQIRPGLVVGSTAHTSAETGVPAPAADEATPAADALRHQLLQLLQRLLLWRQRPMWRQQSMEQQQQLLAAAAAIPLAANMASHPHSTLEHILMSPHPQQYQQQPPPGMHDVTGM